LAAPKIQAGIWPQKLVLETSDVLKQGMHTLLIDMKKNHVLHASS
jgi:hypothetical protein